MKNSLNILVFIAICAGFYFFGANFFATILGLCFLIFFHELGHFLAARSLNIEVPVFSVGFGKAIYQKKIGETTYQIAAIPFGGYVKIKGQEDENDKSERSYANLKPIFKIYILVAGAFFNFLLAFIFYIFIGFMGKEVLSPKVGNVLENSAAYGVLLKGDLILQINENEINQWQDIKKYLNKSVSSVKVLRDNNVLSFDIALKMGDGVDDFGRDEKRYMLGISPLGDTHKIYHKGLSSIKYAYDSLIESSMLIAKGLYLIIKQDIDHKNLGGMIMLSDVTSKSIGVSFSTYLLILAAISVNLGVVNLLPIPPLDGGHIFVNLYELLFRHKAPDMIYNALNYVGLFLLISLMFVANLNDVFRYFING